MLLMVASPLFNGQFGLQELDESRRHSAHAQTYDKELWKDAADAAKTVIDMTEYQLAQTGR